ncbi:ribonuclease catalytic domain-containing protein [Basilea psittacipulmonis]|uniref:ribonuclease catalytic domain-containing protein n=1 Tax=Basilea psittacipulmonis TaxID=1472345 RepID=UPI00068D0250|nr:ribonuclease catalytic domain-containing protein [Basilea psittacipulmonis]
MQVIYEDSGQIKLGTVISETESKVQIKTDSGKDAKIKRANIIFMHPQMPEQIFEQAQQLADAIDIPFLWECAPKEDFSVQDIAQEYYGQDGQNILYQVAIFLALRNHPIYFYKSSKTSFKPATKETIDLALQAIAKKQQQQALIETWANELIHDRVPDEIRQVAETFLDRPDKNSLEWKAFDLALEKTGRKLNRFLMRLNIYPHELALLKAQYLLPLFPQGKELPDIEIPKYEDLPASDRIAYSVDDPATTEIDDAFSVKAIGNNIYEFGIHIAAPALAVTPDSPLDKIARDRQSTLYLPGEKVYMQPEHLIDTFSLLAGRHNPAVSLYVTANIETGEILKTTSKIDTVFVETNFHTNVIAQSYTRETLADPNVSLPCDHVFRPIWQLTQHLQKKREDYRGRPEFNHRKEFTFSLDGSPENPDSTVILTPRWRDDPIDLMVAEMMILANSTWAKLLHEANVPAIYRSQEAGRTRTSTYANPHEGVGVPYYAWCTSPLRRYLDLINQMQLISVIKHGVSARLIAPFQQSKQLYGIIREFDERYALYAVAQGQFERFRALKYIQQNQVTQATATVLKDNIVRLDEIPLKMTLHDLPDLERRTHIQVALGEINFLDLSIQASYLNTLSDEQTFNDDEEDNL